MEAAWQRGFTGILGRNDREVNYTSGVLYDVSSDFNEIITQRLIDHVGQQWGFLITEEKNGEQIIYGK